LPVRVGTKHLSKFTGRVFTVVASGQDQVTVRSNMTGRLHVWPLEAPEDWQSFGQAPLGEGFQDCALCRPATRTML
jgi:hypothetical protein